MPSENSTPPPPSPGAGQRRASLVDIFSTQRSGSVASAAIQAQQRRLSLTTIGLGNLNPATPFVAPHASAGTVDESPFEEDDAPASSLPTSPFARRLSFGARAMRDLRSPSIGNGNANGHGYDFAENMRHRAAERMSVSGPLGFTSPLPTRTRAKSIAVVEPPKEMPVQPSKRPDAFQERILKGDFYYD